MLEWPTSTSCQLLSYSCHCIPKPDHFHSSLPDTYYSPLIYSGTTEKFQKDLIMSIFNLKTSMTLGKIKILQFNFQYCCFYTWSFCLAPPFTPLSWSTCSVVINFFEWLLCVLCYPTSSGHTIHLVWNISFSFFIGLKRMQTTQKLKNPPSSPRNRNS